MTSKIIKALEIVFFFITSVFFRFIKKYDNLWLICERGDDARDNGYSFFNYLREHQPEINAYYLISKDCDDYGKAIKHGNIILYKSFKHKSLFFLTRYLITAHKGTIEPWNYKIYRSLFGIFNKSQKYVFIQHGVILHDVRQFLCRSNTNFDLFISGAKPEYYELITNYGYDESEIVYTGLARHDELHDITEKNQILFFPTWRNYLKYDVKSRKLDDFTTGNYYRSIQSLLYNYELARILTRYNYKLYFYLHNEMVQYIDYFKSNNSRIIIVSEHSRDIQKYIKESKMLITDYSSVSVDFAYMKKPVVYYQFDKQLFFNSHYSKGYFSYEEDGFGPVFTDENDLITYIKMCLDNNFEVEKIYDIRMDRFFSYRDKNNNKRIFESIKNLNQDKS
ncbi:CDP-glycerol--poly(glycerophosphate) glycerophosphotransferase [Paenibacillus dendritiformis]|nr:CDP-glycerol glycerophosphotransferase family protein [Paenibacillus dendritiformis]NKI24247.1 CDP-glycerol--poly(glycerophosphate) glycerophosphotransferase [Paenibacillus dendritiformis]